MTKTIATPAISIGMPVFNGEQFIITALDSILGQSFTDFELIISDNASTDETERICRDYAKLDKRIRYFRQPSNIGATANFKFVLDQSGGEYFTWAACDDTRSPDFIAVNFNFLSQNPEYVASTSPNGFDNRPADQRLINFALDGGRYERFVQFYSHCWISHGMFYSLIRTKVLRGCAFIGQSFMAADWAIILYLAKHGRINRSNEGWMISGTKGVSSSSNAFDAFRNHVIERIFPLFKLTKITCNLMKGFSARQKIKVFLMLSKINCQASKAQLMMSLRAISHK